MNSCMHFVIDNINNGKAVLLPHVSWDGWDAKGITTPTPPHVCNFLAR
jgi:hypothetical protein